MSSRESLSLRDRLFVATQYLLPQHFLSRLVYHLTRSRSASLKNLLIRSFMRGFSPEMSEALQPDPLAYGSFNEFFTRALKPGARPMDHSDVLVSPVDGAVSQMGRLDGTQLMQAKGHSYSLEALLDCDRGGRSVTETQWRESREAPTARGGGEQWASRFVGGCFATLYLAPFNYHRIHMPLAGTLRAAWYVPGKLFSVNAVTAASVPGCLPGTSAWSAFSKTARCCSLLCWSEPFSWAAWKRSGTAKSPRAAPGNRCSCHWQQHAPRSNCRKGRRWAVSTWDPP